MSCQMDGEEEKGGNMMKSSEKEDWHRNIDKWLERQKLKPLSHKSTKSTRLYMKVLTSTSCRLREKIEVL